MNKDKSQTTDETKAGPETEGILKSLGKRLIFILFIITAKTVERIPDKICYGLASICGTLFFIFDFPLGLRAIRNLRHTGVADSFGKAFQTGRQSFICLTKLAVDIFKADRQRKLSGSTAGVTVAGSEESIKRFFPADGTKAEHAIISSAHFGNWEVIGQAYSGKTGITLTSIMRPFDNQYVGKYILKRRTGEGHSVCDKRGGIRAMLKALKRGGSAGILPDQHASRKDGGVEVNFFGHPARTHTTPARLHLQTGVPIMVLLCRRVSDNFKFEFIVSPPIIHTPTNDQAADVLAITQRVNDETEKIIRQYPGQWLWSHRRWLDIDR